MHAKLSFYLMKFCKYYKRVGRKKKKERQKDHYLFEQFAK